MRLPPPLSWLWSGWMALSHAIGLVMSTILLTVLWIIGIGSYAVIYRIIIACKRKSTPASYWVDAAPEYPGSMRHQF